MADEDNTEKPQAGATPPEPAKAAPRAPSPASTNLYDAPVHDAGIRVKWYVDALVEGHVYHGFIKSISMSGTEIYLDLNLQKIKTIKLRIHVPPASKTSAPLLMEVSGRVLFTSYDNQESLFHIGVHFTEFRQESDRKYLQSRIAAFNKTK